MTHQQQATPLSPQSVCNDILNTLKHLIGCYSERVMESATPAVRERFTQIWQQHQQSAYQMFQFMQQRGWYTAQPAQQQKIQTVLQTAQQLTQSLFPSGQAPHVQAQPQVQAQSQQQGQHSAPPSPS